MLSGKDGGASQGYVPRSESSKELSSYTVGAVGGLFPFEAAGLMAEAGQPQAKATFQFGDIYLATVVKSGLMLVDIEAAHERILYEKFMKRGAGEGLSQQAIFPVTVELSPTQNVLLEEVWDEVCRLGFTLEKSAPGVVCITGAPTEAYSGTEKELLEGLLEQYAQNRNNLRVPKPEQVARALAARNARRNGKRTLDITEQEALIGRLFTCQVPNITPDGRPVTVLLGSQAIDGWFGK
jgi:DNA mismatch repair protein MutL